ncbi:MAG: hypothetical protein NZ920_00920 [Aigarchaeota archaeon]|nr:hypothetical protein [Aigarchaeota archaeon]MDW8093004.1 hypothetical protein [Nitrososphaerota archaeon]
MSGKGGAEKKPKTVAELIRQEAGIEKGSKSPGKETAGDLTIRSVIKIAKEKIDDMDVKSLKAAVRSVVGVCQSMGVRVEGKEPKEFLIELERGTYDELFK